MKEHEIIRALSEMKDSQDSFFMAHVKTGSTWFNNRLRIVDAVSVKRSWAKPCITIYEIKTTRSDFVNDEKWPDYLQYCHRFYFACPQGLVKPDELQGKIGLIYVNEQGKAYTKKKTIFRDITIPWELFYYIVLSRLEPDRDPFHASKLEKWKRYIEYKHERKLLGWELSKSIWEELHDLNAQIDKLKSERHIYEGYSDLLEKEELNMWDVQDIIRNRKKIMTPRLENALKIIAKHFEMEQRESVLE